MNENAHTQRIGHSTRVTMKSRRKEDAAAAVKMKEAGKASGNVHRESGEWPARLQ